MKYKKHINKMESKIQQLKQYQSIYLKDTKGWVYYEEQITAKSRFLNVQKVLVQSLRDKGLVQ